MNTKTILFLSFKPLVTFLVLKVFLGNANSSKREFICIFFLLLFTLPQVIKEISIIRNSKKLDNKELLKANLPGWDIISASVISFLFFISSVAIKQNNAILILFSIIGPILISKLLFIASLWLCDKFARNR